MNFWDTTKDMAQLAAHKVEKTIQVEKIRLQVQKQNSKVKKTFELLGQCYYENQKEAPGQPEEALLANLCREVDRELALLQELKFQLEQAKNQE